MSGDIHKVKSGNRVAPPRWRILSGCWWQAESILKNGLLLGRSPIVVLSTGMPEGAS